MMPVSRFACALVLAGGLTTPAFAQTNATPTPGSTGDQSDASGQSALSNDQSSDQSPIYNGNSNGQAAMHICSALRGELTKAGYTDMAVVRRSEARHI
jgi:hypothetical protein